MTTRTKAETKLLREEAERLARMDWRRPEISRLLGVPMHTLNRWAFEGGWRAKDLAADGEPERLAALHEQLAQQRLQYARSVCGRSAARLEYKSADNNGADDTDAMPKPAADPAPNVNYPSSDPDHGPWEPDKTLPKFLTRGGPADEQVRWAAPELRVKTPPWAPGNVYEDSESASLFLAEDLMRQGLLSEAEKALRFTKNWLTVSRQVFDKQDEEDARRREYHEREAREREREKARCKALGLPDPDEVWKAQFAEWEKRRSSSSSSSSSGGAANPNSAVPRVTDA
jgi:hypothetical protein